jgi:hypothetical protein
MANLEEFLAALAVDPKKLGEFIHDPDTVMKAEELSDDDATALRSGFAGVIHARLAGVEKERAFTLIDRHPQVVVDIGLGAGARGAYGAWPFTPQLPPQLPPVYQWPPQPPVYQLPPQLPPVYQLPPQLPPVYQLPPQLPPVYQLPPQLPPVYQLPPQLPPVFHLPVEPPWVAWQSPAPSAAFPAYYPTPSWR